MWQTETFKLSKKKNKKQKSYAKPDNEHTCTTNKSKLMKMVNENKVFTIRWNFTHLQYSVLLLNQIYRIHTIVVNLICSEADWWDWRGDFFSLDFFF